MAADAVLEPSEHVADGDGEYRVGQPPVQELCRFGQLLCDTSLQGGEEIRKPDAESWTVAADVGLQPAHRGVPGMRGPALEAPALGRRWRRHLPPAHEDP